MAPVTPGRAERLNKAAFARAEREIACRELRLAPRPRPAPQGSPPGPSAAAPRAGGHGRGGGSGWAARLEAPQKGKESRK